MPDDDTTKVNLSEIDGGPGDEGVTLDRVPALTAAILGRVVEHGEPLETTHARLLEEGVDEELAGRVVLAASYGLRFVTRHLGSARTFRSRDLVEFLAERGIPRELGSRVAEGFEAFGSGQQRRP